MYDEVSSHLRILYRRLPTETYLFVETLLDQLRAQITADGYLGHTDASQNSELAYSSSSNPTTGSSQFFSSQTNSEMENGESATEVDQDDI